MKYLTLSLFLTIFLLSGFANRPEIDREAQLKFEKTFIWAFTKYINWPDNDCGDVFEIATYNFSEMTPFVEELKVNYEKVKGIPIVVRELSSDDLINDLDLSETDIILSMNSKDESEIEKFVSGPEQTSILYICEACDKYKMMRFVEIDGKTKFELNSNNMEALGFKVDGVLKDLAAKH